MTEYTRETLDRYEIRKTKQQKTAFIQYLTDTARNLGYESHVEKGLLSRNVVIGNPETAKVIYTAHYDTCVRLPFPNFITPTCFPLYLLYQMVLTVLILLPLATAMALLMGISVLLSNYIDQAILTAVVVLLYWVLLALDLILFFFGPANPHTANDNTSGVTTLLEIMAALPEPQRDKAAFVFFDLEESGLIGSSHFAKKHKKEMKQKLLINFDCVSDGQTMIFAVKKKARPYAELLEQAFQENDFVSPRIFTRGIFYPSDQANFPCGVGVAALNQTRSGLLYLSRIHTKRDTVYRQENIDYLTRGAVKLIHLI